MYNKDKHNYEVDDYHVLILELDCPIDKRNQTLRISNIEHYLKNYLIRELNKRYDQLNHLRRYHRLKQAYHKIQVKQEKLEDTNDPKYQELEEDKADIKTKLNNLIKQYGLTMSDTKKLATSYISKYDIHTVFVTTTVEDVYDGMKDVLYGDGEKLNFKSRKTDLPSIRAKEVTRGISLKLNKKTNELTVKIGQAAESQREPIVLNFKPIKKLDYFAQDEITLLKEYLADKNGNDEKCELPQTLLQRECGFY